jgi:hypothetical protein
MIATVFERHPLISEQWRFGDPVPYRRAALRQGTIAALTGRFREATFHA